MPLKVSKISCMTDKDKAEKKDRYRYYISGDNGQAAYEKAIFFGDIPCPYTVEFRDTEGNIVSTRPIPLDASGKPKINLFPQKD